MVEPAGQTVKVLHVAETAQGGVGSYIEELVPVQVARHGPGAVRVLLPREHAAHFKRLPAAALRVFDIAGAGRLRCMLRMAWHTLAEVRRWRPDVVHVHSTYAGFVLRPLLAAWPGGPRVVYCAHGWAFDRRAPRWLNAAVAGIERIWSAWCDAVVCISRHDHASAVRAGVPAHRLVVVANGIGDVPATTLASMASGLAPTELWPEGALRVLFVGRLDQQKGVDVLYAALRRLSTAPRSVAAVVVGSAVVASDQAAVPPPQVQITGWLAREQIAALYEAADVLVVPSRWEGFGLVALEAMRAGRAVFASRVGGLPEVVEDGVTGCLFAPEDAEALAALLTDVRPARLAQMGAAGRLRYERLFHVERVADELDALYRRVLARSASAESKKATGAVSSAG